MKFDIHHIAKLACLKMDEQQAQRLSLRIEELGDIIDSLPDVKGSVTGLDPDNPMELRDDIAVASECERDEILACAPQVEAGCIVVPRIVE